MTIMIIMKLMIIIIMITGRPHGGEEHARRAGSAAVASPGTKII